MEGYQILSTHSLRKSKEISLENLYVDIEAWRVKFPFNLIGKMTMAFLTGQSCCILKFWWAGGDPKKDLATDRLTQKLSSICGTGSARLELHNTTFAFLFNKVYTFLIVINCLHFKEKNLWFSSTWIFDEMFVQKFNNIFTDIIEFLLNLLLVLCN